MPAEEIKLIPLQEIVPLPTNVRLLPVVKDGIIISGMHRKAVDPKWPEVSLEIKDELDRIVKTIHYNVQLRPTMKETASRLLRVAKILESRGVKKPDICRALAELIPYSPRHIEAKQRAKEKMLNELG